MKVAKEWDISLLSHLCWELSMCSTVRQLIRHSGTDTGASNGVYSLNIFYFSLPFNLSANQAICQSCINLNGWKSINKPVSWTSIKVSIMSDKGQQWTCPPGCRFNDHVYQQLIFASKSFIQLTPIYLAQIMRMTPSASCHLTGVVTLILSLGGIGTTQPMRITGSITPVTSAGNPWVVQR